MLAPQGPGLVAKSRPRRGSCLPRFDLLVLRTVGDGASNELGSTSLIRVLGLFLALAVVALIGLGAVGVALAEGPKMSHTVAPGDTVYRIAREYRVSPKAIIEANRLTDPDHLRPGDEIIVPPPEPEAAPAPLTSPPPASVGQPARTHLVAPGETLTRIAREYGVTVDQLVAENSLTDPGRIRSGYELVIPDPERAQPDSRGGQRPDEPIRGPERSFLVTHYCLTGTMANGRPVRSGAAASDRSVVPLGSLVELEGLGFLSIEDQFAVDLGLYRLDIWVPSCQEARARGVERRRGWVILQP